MNNFITSEEHLRSLIPNMITSVKGEMPLIERLSDYLNVASEWAVRTFFTKEVFIDVCDLDDSSSIKRLTGRLIVAEALRLALPALDIVLTPNGFAVVNTSNLAPASKPRVDRLAESMLAQRDDCIAAMLAELSYIAVWRNSSRGRFFGDTLFPNLDVVDALGTVAGSRWEKYLELRPRIIDLEASLAEEWFSPELMAALRSQNLRGSLSMNREVAANHIKSQIVEFLRSGSLNSRRLADIVNFIRINPDDFEEWHSSKTAALFAPPVFRNRKQSSGYFF